jgi:RNA ligase (TIGR02306 family)
MSLLTVEVCRIDNIKKCENADKLSLVTVKGWNCVVGLNQYQVGDLVVFVPPDCIIPNNLIEKYNLEYLKKNGKTGTVKLRGYLSQGLILDLPDGNWKIGDDVSSVLGITKWVAPEPPAMRGAMQTSKKKINPLFDKYTDIENIKNYSDIFKPGDFVVVTEKIHGCNSRFSNLEIVSTPNQPILEKLTNLFQKYILRKTHQFVYGSHNVQITSHSNRNSFYGDDVWGKIAKRYDFANIIPEDMIIYGEIYGDGIQDLTYGLKNEIDFRVFDIKHKGQYFNWYYVLDICGQLGLKTVPVLYVGKFYDGIISDYTNGNTCLNVEQIREGIVIKMFDEENHPRLGRKILKSVSEEYLLRKNATEYQ